MHSKNPQKLVFQGEVGEESSDLSTPKNIH